MLVVRVKGQDFQVQGLPELDQWRRDGRVTDDTAVYDPGVGEWRTVSDLLTPAGSPVAAMPLPTSTSVPLGSVGPAPISQPQARTVVMHQPPSAGGAAPAGTCSPRWPASLFQVSAN
jgi:hypothetical protein